MTDATERPATEGPLARRFRGGWIVEIIAIRAIYQLYTWIRNGPLQGSTHVAFRHAKQVLRLEELLGLDHERTIQRWALPHEWFIGFANVYHGPPHMVVTIVCFVWLYRAAPKRYVRWRNAFVLMLPLALLGFWLYPLMPPANMPARYGIVDTKAEYFNFGGPQRIEYEPDGEPTDEYLGSHGNPYAGMPSLHVGWAVWSVLAVWPLARRRWQKGALIGHLILSSFAVTVTGQHRLIDIAAGCALLAAAYGLAVLVERGLALRRSRPGAPNTATATEAITTPTAAPPTTSSG